MNNTTFKTTLLNIIKLSALGVLVGALGGLVGAAFSHTLSFVTTLRESAPWLILLLPVGAVATAFLYRIFKAKDVSSTNEIILCIAHNKPVRFIAAPLIFVCSAISHLFGGSAGREGAALQLGGASASWLSRVLKLNEDDASAISTSGMSAVFAGLFGAPLTAAFFVLEFRSNFKKLLKTVFPVFISSIVADKLCTFLGVETEKLHLLSVPEITLPTLLKTILLTLAVGLLGWILCFLINAFRGPIKHALPNIYLSSALFGALLIVLTALVGDMRYNGSGMPLVMSAVEGRADRFDFLLKLAFTCVTLAAGLKGGEIVPTFSVGATFGCVFGSLLGLSPSLSAVLGLIGLFCVSTNSPISAVFLGIELCGVSALPYYLLVCLILWPISARKGLFKNRFFEPLPILRKG